jgi:hypothetical protein
VIPDDEKLRRFLATSAIGYAVAGLNLLVRRKSFESDMKRIDGKRKPPDIWPALGVAYMATIAAVAWSASRDRQRAAELVKPLLVAKATTTALFANQFLRTRRRSFLLATIVDGGILAATLWLSSRAGHTSRLRAVDNLRRLKTG